MSVSEQVLDWVQALIWPALIVVGVWVFRSQVRGLLDRIKSVEAGGVKVELGRVAEVLKESVRETREEVAKAENPEERQRAVDKLQREAAALGQVRAYENQTAAAKAAARIYPAGLSDLRIGYLDAVDDVLGDRVVNPGDRFWLDEEFRWWFDRRLQQYVEEGLTREQITERLGSPWGLVEEWAGEEGYEEYLNHS
jgi:hypothetical protein